MTRISENLDRIAFAFVAPLTRQTKLGAGGIAAVLVVHIVRPKIEGVTLPGDTNLTGFTRIVRLSTFPWIEPNGHIGTASPGADIREGTSTTIESLSGEECVRVVLARDSRCRG